MNLWSAIRSSNYVTLYAAIYKSYHRCPVNTQIWRSDSAIIGIISLHITCWTNWRNQAVVHCSAILSQILRFVPRYEFESLASRHHSGRAFRTATRWSQLVTMMAMAQLSGRIKLAWYCWKRECASTPSLSTWQYKTDTFQPCSHEWEYALKLVWSVIWKTIASFANVWHQVINSALRTSFIFWMHQLLTCACLSFHGLIFAWQKGLSSCVWVSITTVICLSLQWSLSQTGCQNHRRRQ